MFVPPSLLVLTSVALGLAFLAYLQVRDVFWTGRDWRRELRKYRRAFLRRVPRNEQVAASTRLFDALRRLNRVNARWHRVVEEITENRDVFENQVRNEIDKLVGKDVYQGQKEQL